MIIILIKIILWLILLTLAITALSLAPWVPTRKKDLKRVKTIVDLKEGQSFYDLGCGDGRVASYISKNSKVKAIGIELAVPFYLICKIREFFSKNKNLEFKLKSLFQEDLSQADAIYLFAANSKKLTGKIVDKLNNELKPGAKVISYAFPINAWKAKLIDRPTPNDVAIYLYEIK